MCDKPAGFFGLVSLILAALGVIGDALDVTFVLESNSWLLLAIFVGLVGIIPYMNYVMARNLYGIESEREKK